MKDSPYWQRLRELFHPALELDETARAEFLDQACAADEALRREIESLVAAAREIEAGGSMNRNKYRGRRECSRRS